MNQSFFLKIKIIIWFLLISLTSCKTADVNYVYYYQQVVEIDSIYRFAGQHELAAKKYKKLFRKYEPRNQERIEEFGTYLTLADQYNIKFGGKKSLKKLIHLLAPGAHHNWQKPYYPLFQKYGIDSLDVQNEIVQWRSGLNKELLDSFSMAMERDQLPRENGDYELAELNEEKNYQLFKWAFEKYGFPSQQEIGIKGNLGRNIHISTILLHLRDIEEYDSLKNKVWQYVKSGDCPPEFYAYMVDGNRAFHKQSTLYLKFPSIDDTIDSVRINKNRKKIGLPSIKHGVRITQDFWKKMEKNHDSDNNE